MEGTNLQEVFDAFFIKVPSTNFYGKESEVIQLMKSAIALCHRHVYDNLDYVYDGDDDELEGYFKELVSASSIELISMFMAVEYFQRRLSLLNARKQYLGTQAFNKIPSNKEDFENIKSSLDYWNDKIDRFLMEFPDYSDER